MEIWKDIPEYEGLYQASTLGRIRTVEGKTTYTERHGVRHWKSRVLKHKGSKKIGYRVSLWKSGKGKDFLVHRLVAMTFLGLPPEGYTVNHIDGNRENNCIDNLEWLSLGDNIRHGFTSGLYSKTQHPIFLVCEEKSLHFVSMAEASRFLGKNHSYISNCINKNRRIIADDGKKYTIKKAVSNHEQIQKQKGCL